MRRIIVFGGDGIIGSCLYLALKESFDLCVTLHGKRERYPPRLFDGAQVMYDVSAGDAMRVRKVLNDFCPEWVINAVGLVKRDLASDPLASLEANTLFPHLLAKLCGENRSRFLQFSTDCVYSGTAGMYKESDQPDSNDWHGRCKALGEPNGAHVLVLRTSFIGLELACKRSLLEWFLAQRGGVPGYRKAIWSGFTAMELARLVGALIGSKEPLCGLWHVATPAISKFDLLTALNAQLGERGVRVLPDDSFVCNRSLDGSAFSKLTGYVPPSWDEMLNELAEDIRARWVPDAPSYWKS
ncbi:sugar nucleotide-binding protein [Propionivibrio sp.]|uniref:sugar nucleotide-binding protein n=1 Tax=Propionivibrio sp. TaxID=2212460 RepID=UPI00261F9119|nr:sugar nucleotide-binding protein [Propionivibrio sp.]MBK8402031.1 sugar nucleotide-binding protein [Propionivibrio sp.]